MTVSSIFLQTLKKNEIKHYEFELESSERFFKELALALRQKHLYLSEGAALTTLSVVSRQPHVFFYGVLNILAIQR